MVYSAAVLSSSLALSLLRHSSPPSESFVLSPFSLNTALSIVNIGAGGKTQQELTNLLPNRCTPADVTNHYSSLSLSLLAGNKSGVSFASANRFYVDESISLKRDYLQFVKDKYTVLKVENLKMSATDDAAKKMNKFVEEATNGKIKEIIKADGLSNDVKSVFINAIYFLGNWRKSFNARRTKMGTFHGAKGDRQVDFMKQGIVCNITETDAGLTVILPYENSDNNFFLVQPTKNRSLAKLRNEITGEKLQSLLRNTQSSEIELTIPKFNISSNLDGRKVLQKLGVNSIFSNAADLSKISDTPLKVDSINHQAVIEVDEKGTTAAAATSIGMIELSAEIIYKRVAIDRPFLFGIRRHNDILFLGQYA